MPGACLEGGLALVVGVRSSHDALGPCGEQFGGGGPGEAVVVDEWIMMVKDNN